MADPDRAPKVTIIRDVQGRQMAYLSMEIGFAHAVEYVGPSYQKMMYAGQEAVCVFADHSLNRFIFAPAIMKEILSASCEHVYDIPKQPANRPLQPQLPVLAPRIVATTTAPFEEEQQLEASRALAESTDNHPPSARASPVQVKKQQRIKRPRNSWIIYRSEKSKELHQCNATMSAAAISTEVARMWANATAEVKRFYAELAALEAEAHKEQHPNWKYQPAKR